MNISMKREASKLTISLEGRLDTSTSPRLLETISEELTPEVSELVLDLEKLDYLSSAGLRVILTAQKRMKKQGSLVVRHVNESIMEVFEITGFAGILTIQ